MDTIRKQNLQAIKNKNKNIQKSCIIHYHHITEGNEGQVTSDINILIPKRHIKYRIMAFRVIAPDPLKKREHIHNRS